MIQLYKNSWEGNKSVKFINGCGLHGIGIISFYGCNFQCPFCFAQKYSYSRNAFPIDNKNKIEISEETLSGDLVNFLKLFPQICYIQLTGGEPIINESRLDNTIKTLLIVDKQIQSNIRVIYQTNGSFIGHLGRLPSSLHSLTQLRNIKVLFEVSIKGTNESEFALLSGTHNKDGFKNQIGGYWLLRAMTSDNIDTVARLGTGHHRRSIHFINPETEESLFKRNNWDKEFVKVFTDNTERVKQRKMIAECINAEGDGGVNNYVHRSLPAIARCVESGCVTSRTNSSAISQAVKKYNIKNTISTTNIQTYFTDYLEFLRYFEPMGDPSHSYCGRNEFKPAGRICCTNNCRYYPRRI